MSGVKNPDFSGPEWALRDQLEKRLLATARLLKDRTIDKFPAEKAFLLDAAKGKYGIPVKNDANDIIRHHPQSRVPENCLHNMKAWYMNPTFVQPAGFCPICQGELDIHLFKPVDPIDQPSLAPFGNGDRPMPAVAFHCTHMMCRDCYHTFTSQKRGASFVCPLCRTSNKAMRCDCPLQPIRVPSVQNWDTGSVIDTPLTVPEAGKLPKFCGVCAASPEPPIVRTAAWLRESQRS